MKAGSISLACKLKGVPRNCNEIAKICHMKNNKTLRKSIKTFEEIWNNIEMREKGIINNLDFKDNDDDSNNSDNSDNSDNDDSQIEPNYINTNKLEYRGMYNWMHDLPKGTNAKIRFEKAIFKRVSSPINSKLSSSLVWF
jgi:hypothetical protein